MTPRAAVIGAGPAGLMAAEVLLAAGVQVDLFDAMPSVGRKLLLAGKGGLNLTHSEPQAPFLTRYGTAAAPLEPMIKAFDGPALRDWAAALGVQTFVGSSGRVFPTDLKAAPLLRAWLNRLRAAGLRTHMRHRWKGWATGGALDFESQPAPALRPDAAALRPDAPALRPDVTVLALGGASWARLGSDGAWVPILKAQGVPVSPLQPANCGFDRAQPWSDYLRTRYAGQPVKPVVAHWAGRRQQGEFVITETGVEGSLVYAFSAELRETIAREGRATWFLDLLPDHPLARVIEELQRPRGPRSLATHLKSRLGVAGLKLALLHEALGRDGAGHGGLPDAEHMARLLKAYPLELAAPRPLDEAISTAGGVAWSGLDEHLMLKALPGIFCAGEMLDWEAPTGGYLLTASWATGRWAGLGALAWLQRRDSSADSPSSLASPPSPPSFRSSPSSPSSPLLTAHSPPESPHRP